MNTSIWSNQSYLEFLSQERNNIACQHRLLTTQYYGLVSWSVNPCYLQSLQSEIQRLYQELEVYNKRLLKFQLI